MDKGENGEKDFSTIGSDEVVILPAFGATIDELQTLDKKYVNTHPIVLIIFIFLTIIRGVQIVDATCPWVSKVWNAVDSHRQSGKTRLASDVTFHSSSKSRITV